MIEQARDIGYTTTVALFSAIAGVISHSADLSGSLVILVAVGCGILGGLGKGFGYYIWLRIQRKYLDKHNKG